MYEASEAFARAREELKEGRSARAEAIVEDALRRAIEQRGQHSAEVAIAGYELSTILLAIGDRPRAIGALRDAARSGGTDEAGVKARLMVLMNLGELLTLAGQYEEAQQILEDGLAERQRFYGKEHAGYAYGLESLAGLLFKRGALERAAALIDEATTVFWNCGHPHVATVLSTRARILKSRHGHDHPAFRELEGFPNEHFETMVRECVSDPDGEPTCRLAVLTELEPLVAGRFGEDSVLRRDVLNAMSNAAHAAEQHELRLDLLHRLQPILKRQGRARDAVACLLAVAGTQARLARWAAAEESYEEARRAAERLGSDEAVSTVLRDHGLHLSERERRHEATAVLRAAVEAGRRSGDATATGQALVALGILEQHEGNLRTAGDLLREARSVLPATDPDVLYCLSHLLAIEKDASCGCGDMTEALGLALEPLVQQQLPAGLLKRLRYSSEDDGKVDVELARQPTAEEMRLMDNVISHALTLMRAAMRRGTR
jgi:tetratricopeptide (TPR) repeat protein